MTIHLKGQKNDFKVSPCSNFVQIVDDILNCLDCSFKYLWANSSSCKFVHASFKDRKYIGYRFIAYYERKNPIIKNTFIHIV